MDDDSENKKAEEQGKNKKAKGTRKYVIKRRLMFENYIDWLVNKKVILRS